MKNGTYRYALEMSTPLGRRRGYLELCVCKDVLSGSLNMFTRTTPILEGRCSGNQICFRGDMKTPMKTLPYAAGGTATDTGITLTLSTPQGLYPVEGILAEGKRS